MNRSLKTVKPFKQLIRPFTIKPERDIYGHVNGKPFYFPKGVEKEMTYEEYGAIFYSNFKGEL